MSDLKSFIEFVKAAPQNRLQLRKETFETLFEKITFEGVRCHLKKATELPSPQDYRGIFLVYFDQDEKNSLQESLFWSALGILRGYPTIAVNSPPELNEVFEGFPFLSMDDEHLSLLFQHPSVKNIVIYSPEDKWENLPLAWSGSKSCFLTGDSFHEFYLSETSLKNLGHIVNEIDKGNLTHFKPFRMHVPEAAKEALFSVINELKFSEVDSGDSLLKDYDSVSREISQYQGHQTFYRESQPFTAICGLDLCSTLHSRPFRGPLLNIVLHKYRHEVSKLSSNLSGNRLFYFFEEDEKALEKIPPKLDREVTCLSLPSEWGVLSPLLDCFSFHKMGALSYPLDLRKSDILTVLEDSKVNILSES